MKPFTLSSGSQGDLVVSLDTAVATLRNNPRHHVRLAEAVGLLKSQLAATSEKMTKIISDVHPDKALAQVTKALDEGIGPAWVATLKASIAADTENRAYDTKRGVSVPADAALEREHRDRFADLTELEQVKAAHSGDIALLSAIFRDHAPKTWKFDSGMAARIKTEMRLAAHRAFIERNYPKSAKPTLETLIPQGPDEAAISELLALAEQQRSEMIDDVVAAETFIRGVVVVSAAATERDPTSVFDVWVGNSNG